MAIAKGADLKTTTLMDYIIDIKATSYGVKDKSIHFQAGEIYLGFINRSTENKKIAVSLDQNILLDGKYGADWLCGPSEIEWIPVPTV
jgi:hypothetical protein